jgi:hypothetical protein
MNFETPVATTLNSPASPGLRTYLNRQESEKSVGEKDENHPRNYIRKPRYTFRSPNLTVLGFTEQRGLDDELIGSSVVIGQEFFEGALRTRINPEDLLPAVPRDIGKTPEPTRQLPKIKAPL